MRSDRAHESKDWCVSCSLIHSDWGNAGTQQTPRKQLVDGSGRNQTRLAESGKRKRDHIRGQPSLPSSNDKPGKRPPPPLALPLK